MKKIIVMLSAFVLLAACGSNKTDNKTNADLGDEAKGQQLNNGDADSSSVEITEEQMKAVRIETDTAQLKELTATVKVNGMLTVPNQNKALVTSVTNGVIRSLLIQPGNLVTKGQVIATIINPDVAPLQQQLQVANAQIELAKLEQARQKELVEGNAAPLKNLQKANTELATLNATRNALQQQLSTMGISSGMVSSGKINTTLDVLAPITGTVSQVMSQIGSNVDASTPIASIVNNDQLHLDIFVYEKDLPRIKVKQTIHFVLTNMQGREYDAEIYSIGAAFASDTKTVPVHAVVKGNKTGLIDGMNITAVISTGTAKVAAVPSDAIITVNGFDYVFMLQEKDKKGAGYQDNVFHFKKIPVSKGASDVGFTEIIPITPIPTGAKLVTKGAFFVLAKMTNKGEEE